MRYQISRRAVLGGSIAIAGAGAFSGLAVAEDFKLAADEELFVGFSTARPLLQGRHLINWRWLVSNDGRDKFPVWCPPSRFAGAQQLEHGARVWAARRRSASDRRLNQSVRILRVASVDSIEASSARDESERRAWENGQWLKARVLVPVRNRGDSCFDPVSGATRRRSPISTQNATCRSFSDRYTVGSPVGQARADLGRLESVRSTPCERRGRVSPNLRLIEPRFNFHTA